MRYELAKGFPDFMLQGNYLAYKFGSLYKMQKEGDGETRNQVEIIPTGTYEDIDVVAFKDNRFACLVPHVLDKTVLFLTVNDVLSRKAVPDIDKSYSLNLFGDRGLVLYNSSLNIFVSNNNGDDWQSYPNFSNNQSTDLESQVNFYESEKGFYLFKDSVILFYSKVNMDNLKKIPTPGSLLKITWINEIKNGLFIHSGPPYGYDWDLNYLPLSGNAWQIKTLPLLDFSTLSKNKIMNQKYNLIKEKDGNIYINDRNRCFESKDFGSKWQEVSFELCHT